MLAGFALSRPEDEPIRPLVLLKDRGWPAMASASVLAAIGGSADRLIGLGLLAPGALAGYFLLYELLSRFWLLPYLAAPVLFARHAGGRASPALSRRLRLATAGAGLAMVGIVVLASAFAARPLRQAFGLPLGAPAVALAIAIVMAAFTQLIVAELQGRRAVRRAMLVVAIGALLAGPLFFVAARLWGVSGLMVGWLVKSIVELVLALASERTVSRRNRSGSQPAADTSGKRASATPPSTTRVAPTT